MKSNEHRLCHDCDATERLRVEEKLRDSEAEYRILFNCNPHPMWVFDVKTLRFLAANEAAIRHYGYSRSHSRVSSEREPQFTSFCRSPTSGVS
ncbi:MAG TPA: PAS domain-containing protein, partial [Pyrinomonadaceae bacterium]|nr:PAS domain-containing protein [Pyrinomonadaceae bacterium]